MQAVTAINGHHTEGSRTVAIVCTNSEWAALCSLFGYDKERPPTMLDMTRVEALRKEVAGLRRLPSIANNLHKTLQELGHIDHAEATP